MPACAICETIADQPMNGKLFLPVPDTDFRDYLDEFDEKSGLDVIEKEIAPRFSAGFEIESQEHPSVI